MSYEKENQTTSPEVVKEFPVCVCVWRVSVCEKESVCVIVSLLFPFHFVRVTVHICPSFSVSVPLVCGHGNDVYTYSTGLLL